MTRIKQSSSNKRSAGYVLVIVIGAFLALAAVGSSVWAFEHFVLPHQVAVTKPTVVPVKTAPKAQPKTTAPAKQTAPPAATQPAPPVSTTVQTTPPPTTTVATPPPTQPVAQTQPSPGTSVQQLQPTPSTTTAPSSTGTTSTTTTTTSSDPAPATGGYNSTNWSGYVAMNAKFTSVSGTWTVPAVSGTGTGESGDASWVGIGGVNSSDLIQAGTDNTVNADGSVTVIAFYELLPNPAMQITSLKVSVGDTISASVAQQPDGSWTITVSDVTTAKNYTINVAYTSNYASAEWIEEDPSYTNGTLVPFDKFSHVVFSSGNATMNGTLTAVASSNAQPITMVDSSSNPLATPSVFTTDGGFWVYRN